MKKTFRSILAGAVALLAVSCYDDSGLRKDIQKLDDRVTAIEAALNAEVNGINDLATRLAAAEQALSTTNTTVASLVTKLDAVDGKVEGKDAQNYNVYMYKFAALKGDTQFRFTLAAANA